MFDIGASELLVIVIVAIVVIGPKELPRAMRTAGRWIAKMRRVSAHFRTGLDAMIREAELEDMEREWKEKNAKIMAENPPKLPAASAEAAVAESAMEPLPRGNADEAVTDEGAVEEASLTTSKQTSAGTAD